MSTLEIIMRTDGRTDERRDGFSTRQFSTIFAEKLTHTKKYAAWLASGDLYALPVTAVPGCGFLLGFLLKRKGISRASELYEVYTKKKKNFLKYLCCKFGPWNIVYAKTGSTWLTKMFISVGKELGGGMRASFATV